MFLIIMINDRAAVNFLFVPAMKFSGITHKITLRLISDYLVSFQGQILD